VFGVPSIQALLENYQEIPKEFCGYINIAPGSILQKEEKQFFPAIKSDNGLSELLALSNRDHQWEIILVEINSPIDPEERVIVIK